MNTISGTNIYSFITGSTGLYERLCIGSTIAHTSPIHRPYSRPYKWLYNSFANGFANGSVTALQRLYNGSTTAL